MITQSVLEKVAKLSRLGITPDEVVSMTAEIEKIIEYFEQVRNVNLENVQPMTHAVAINLQPRPDVIKSTKCITEQMPYIKRNYFFVPAVLE
jgi:aspartyl-tRNA(Asn)/glutamyl-tRNA(Gln) amidotransferase subunit C